MQLSDLHFGTEQPAVNEALCKLAQHVAPDVAIVTGDITQRARPNQFQAAASFLRDLGIPVLLSVAGNHDIPLFNLWMRWRAPYRNYCALFGSQLQPTYACESLLLLCVNTTRWYRHKNGEISPQQIAAVAEQLSAAAPEQLRIVAMHHPVLAIQAQDETNLARGCIDAITAWSRAGADLILGGHIHLPYVRPLHQHATGLARRVWAIQAGTAVSWRIREGIPNSVNIIRRNGSTHSLQCDVERWDYMKDAGEFQQIKMDTLSLDEKRTSG